MDMLKTHLLNKMSGQFWLPKKGECNCVTHKIPEKKLKSLKTNKDINAPGVYAQKSIDKSSRLDEK